MKNIKSIKLSLGLMGGLGVVALLMAMSPIQAQAYEVNILTDSDLTLGMTGQKVIVLQGLLQELGYMTIPTGVSMGYFGSMTKDGVARYQAAQNISPAAGYFGPATKVVMHQQFLSRGWLTMLGW